MKQGDSWTSISKDLLEDCAQLTKANSIEGEPLHSLMLVTVPITVRYRQQERQRDHHLYTMVQSKERCVHGNRASIVS